MPHFDDRGPRRVLPRIQDMVRSRLRGIRPGVHHPKGSNPSVTIDVGRVVPSEVTTQIIRLPLRTGPAGRVLESSPVATSHGRPLTSPSSFIQALPTAMIEEPREFQRTIRGVLG